jgi:chromosome segregation ATPase
MSNDVSPDRELARLDARVSALGAEQRAELKRIDGDLASLDRLTDAKFVTQRTMLDAQSAQVKVALEAAEKAIAKSEMAVDKRFDGVNEFRNALTDLSAEMATRRELESSIRELKDSLKVMSNTVGDLRSRLDIGPIGMASLQQQNALNQGARAGIVSSREWLLAAVALIGTAVALILAFNG